MMQFTFALMSESDARTIQVWRYEEPYAIYSATASEEGLAQMLEPRSPQYAVRNEQGELIGFFCFGTSARVWESAEPALYDRDRTIDIGLGLRPDLTGRGLGLAFVEAGLAFAREQFAPRYFRLFVLSFNKRARRVYEQAGFTCVRVFVQFNPIYGELQFVEMQHQI
ncbi:MAG TPA: GNAT family protein [Ktedonobacteraceae bacterium]|jgi:RimJ/RimL family protein N-acetyltransferase